MRSEGRKQTQWKEGNKNRDSWGEEWEERAFEQTQKEVLETARLGKA